MAWQITMPQLTDTMMEGAVVRWLKRIGDRIKPGDLLCEIETDKAVFELEAYDAGILAVILVPAETNAKVGEVIAVVATAGELPSVVRQQYSSPRPRRPRPRGKILKQLRRSCRDRGRG